VFILGLEMLIIKFLFKISVNAKYAIEINPEFRVRPKLQQIEGEDFRVWRWLPAAFIRLAYRRQIQAILSRHMILQLFPVWSIMQLLGQYSVARLSLQHGIRYSFIKTQCLKYGPS